MLKRLLLVAGVVACGPALPKQPVPTQLDEEPARAPCIALAPGDTAWPEASLDKPLRAVASYPSRYPPELQKLNIEGVTRFVFHIQRGGRVDPCSVVQLDASPGFEAAGRAWLLNSIYEPPLRNGVPVVAIDTQAFRFRLARF